MGNGTVQMVPQTQFYKDDGTVDTTSTAGLFVILELEENTMTDVKKRDLVVTHLFNAPLSLIWRAWSDPEYVMQWWGPEGFTSPLAQIDFHEGATSLVCMSSPEYGDHYSTWRYEKIVPMQRIEYIHNLADKDGNPVDPVKMGMSPDFPRDQRHTV